MERAASVVANQRPTQTVLARRFRLPSPSTRASAAYNAEKLNKPFTAAPIRWKRRRNLIRAVSKDAEAAFKKTLEFDRLIDLLRDANPRELQKLVAENILAFNENFWIRLATRTDTCKSEDDKKDYEELASSIMNIVDHLVHKTREKIESATDILKAILEPVVNDAEEISWPPKSPETLRLMENVNDNLVGTKFSFVEEAHLFIKTDDEAAAD